MFFKLPIDLRFGRVIYLARFLGILPHAIACAAALTLPKSPFRIAHPLIHSDPAEYNDIVSKVFTARDHYDRGDYSEPILRARVLRAWHESKSKSYFCVQNSLAHARMQQFGQLQRSLVRKVSQALSHEGVDEAALETPPAFDSPAQLNLLRLLFVFAFPDQLMTTSGFGSAKVDADASAGFFELDLPPKVNEEQIEALLPRELHGERCRFAVVNKGAMIYQVRGVSKGIEEIKECAIVLQLLKNVQMTWLVDTEGTSGDVVHLWLRADVEEAVLATANTGGGGGWEADWERADQRAPHSLYRSRRQSTKKANSNKKQALLKLLKKVNDNSRLTSA